MKNILPLLFTFISLTIFGQDGLMLNKNYRKAFNGYEQGKIEYAHKFIDKCLSEKSLKSEPQVLLLKAKIMYAYTKTSKLRAKESNGLKEAMKYADKALDVIPSLPQQEAFVLSNAEFFNQLLLDNNSEAVTEFNRGRYSRALNMFRQSLKINKDDTVAMVYYGACYWESGQELEAVPYFKVSSEMIYAGVLDSNTNLQGYHRIPFVRLGEFYLKRKHFDSAYVVVKNGRSILPNDPDLNKFTYGLMRHRIQNIPPSYDYLFFVQTCLKDFPSDSFFNHRENSIFVYLLHGLAKGNDQNTYDSLLAIYASTKPVKRDLEDFEQVKQYDIFAGMDTSEFYPFIGNYFAEIGLSEAAYASWMANFHRKFGKEQSEKTLMTALLAEPNIVLGEMVLNRYLSLNPKSKTAKETLKNYTLNANKRESSYKELYAKMKLNDAAGKEFSSIREFKSESEGLRFRLISASADSGHFDKSRKMWSEAQNKYPGRKKDLKSLWTKIVKQDFIRNYYGSRVSLSPSNNGDVPYYSWNGNADSCKHGTIPDDVALNVERRINYFRRMAGMNEMIAVTKQDNKMCMFAVLMCEANRNMSHEPNEGWRCYIPAGVDALSTSLLIRDGNPAIAVTAAMGQNHATVGNRRWLLYPNALYMGIGSSRYYSAIRSVDKSREVEDTNKYKNNFIAWPPAQDCPKMLIFKKWSFSMDVDMQGATVSMKGAGGRNIELKQENPVEGYGLNTLVWEPQLSADDVNNENGIMVKVTLKNGKTYSYSVFPIDVKVEE